MSSTLNYGQKALITACRTCFQPGCTCKSETEEIRAKVNRRLGPSHQLEQADYDAICLDLDQHPISDRPTTSGDDEKKRDDGHFDQLVEEAFKVSPVPNEIEIPTCTDGEYTSTLDAPTNPEKP